MWFGNFLQRNSILISAAHAHCLTNASLSSLTSSGPLGNGDSLHSTHSHPTVLKLNTLWIGGSRESSPALLMDISYQPGTDVSGVNLVGFLLFILDLADPFCLVGFGDFILLLSLSESS